jgi:hypothetical protein
VVFLVKTAMVMLLSAAMTGPAHRTIEAITPATK